MDNAVTRRLKHSSNRSPGVLALAIAATLTLTASSVRADEDHECRDYTGPFTSVLIAGPPCTSPLGLCTHGILTGQLPSTYDFTFLTIVPRAADPSTEDYTGSSHITLKHGAELFGQDHGFLHFIAPTTATFQTTVELVRGTRRFEHASGTIVATGVLDFITGNAVGTYVGKICRGDHDDRDDDDRDRDDRDDDD